MKFQFIYIPILLLSFLLICPSAQSSTEFHVTTVDELHESLSKAKPGDTIKMAKGDWRDADIIMDGTRSSNGLGGLPEAPITLRAEIPGETILSGQSRLRIAGQHIVVDGLLFADGYSDGTDLIQFRNGSSNLASHSQLLNTAIIAFNPPDSSTDYKWVSIYGDHNTVENCWFEGMNHKGVQLTVWLQSDAPPSHHRIIGNYFANRAEGDGNGFETIRIGTSHRSENVSRTVVEGNLFERCDGEIEVISSKSVGNEFRRNTFLECRGQLTLRHGSDCVVDGNFFIGNGKPNSSGVRIVGPGHLVTNNYFENLVGENTWAALAIMNGVPDSPLNRYLRAEDGLIALNTFVNCQQSLAIGTEVSQGDAVLPPRAMTIMGNIFQSPDHPIINEVNELEDSTWEFNIFYGPLGVDNFPERNHLYEEPPLAKAEDGPYRPKPEDTKAVVLRVITIEKIHEIIEQTGPRRSHFPENLGFAKVDSQIHLTKENVGPLWARGSKDKLRVKFASPERRQ